MNTSSYVIAEFAANLQFEDIPTEVVRRCEDLLLDTVGSMYAGSTEAPVQKIAAFAKEQGPADGSAQLIPSGQKTSPYFAAMVNAAAAHMVEQDDLHNSSVFHPACVVFPPALAMAQDLNASGKALLTACVVGYEVGIRVGEFLGRSHYKIFHTTATAGTIAAAATVGRLLGLTTAQMQDALGSAGTQAAGLWEFLKTAADSKQLHTAKAAANGLMAASLAAKGFSGAEDIFDGEKGMGKAFSQAPQSDKLVAGLGQRWALLETSFKYHASCRHTHPAADALWAVMQKHHLNADDIAEVQTFVHQAAIDVLGAVDKPATVHQSKFSMGTVLGVLAYNGFAGLDEFEAALGDARIDAFRQKVTMQLDPEVDAAYPDKWLGKVRVLTKDGRALEAFVSDPKGDPGNTLSRDEIEEKVKRLVSYNKAGTSEDATRIIAWTWGLVEGQSDLPL